VLDSSTAAASILFALARRMECGALRLGDHGAITAQGHTKIPCSCHPDATVMLAEVKDALCQVG
jgi:hypothetical protein